MRRVAFALLLASGVGQAQTVSETSPSPSTENPTADGRRLADEVLGHWKSCLLGATDKYARSDESAETVADVALNKCAEWDPAVKKVLVHLIAVDMMKEMPFEEGLKVAEQHQDEMFREAKGKMKLNLVARVLDKRAGEAPKRRRG